MKSLYIALAGALVSLNAVAGAADQISVESPTVRLMPMAAHTTAAFMTLRNAGERDVRVIKAESPAARVVELHGHSNDNGVMRMRQVPAIDIKAKGETALKPGGLHVMLIDLKNPLKEGETVPVTLGFDDGSSKQVAARVVRPGGEAGMGGHHHHH